MLANNAQEAVVDDCWLGAQGASAYTIPPQIIVLVFTLFFYVFPHFLASTFSVAVIEEHPVFSTDQ